MRILVVEDDPAVLQALSIVLEQEGYHVETAANGREALASVLALPDTRKRLADLGMQLTAMSADEFAQFIRSERAKWSKLISDVGIKPQ